MSHVRARVADRFGKLLAEIDADFGSISWRLNEVGRATLTLSKSDPKLTQHLFGFGNRLLLDFDNGLPMWGGVIDPPRDWQSDAVQITAYSGEYILGMRQTPKGRYFSNVSVGYIFEKLIKEMNATWYSGVEFGSAWGGGRLHSPEFHFKNILNICQDSLCSRLEAADFAVVAGEKNGYITFTAHLYERRGSDKSEAVALLEGHNLSRIRLLEQGPIVNSYDVAGEGSTWGTDRITSHAEHAASVAELGLREDSKVFSDTSVQTTLDNTAENLLAETALPSNRLSMDAQNLAPAAFAAYDVGDKIKVQLQTYGFSGYEHEIRVLTREYLPDLDVCRLVVTEAN